MDKIKVSLFIITIITFSLAQVSLSSQDYRDYIKTTRNIIECFDESNTPYDINYCPVDNSYRVVLIAEYQYYLSSSSTGMFILDDARTAVLKMNYKDSNIDNKYKYRCSYLYNPSSNNFEEFLTASKVVNILQPLHVTNNKIGIIVINGVVQDSEGQITDVYYSFYTHDNIPALNTAWPDNTNTVLAVIIHPVSGAGYYQSDYTDLGSGFLNAGASAVVMFYGENTWESFISCYETGDIIACALNAFLFENSLYSITHYFLQDFYESITASSTIENAVAAGNSYLEQATLGDVSGFVIGNGQLVLVEPPPPPPPSPPGWDPPIPI